VIAKRKGCHREAGSEGSAEQRREPMNKNRIRGLQRRTSWPVTAKSTSIKGVDGKFGGLRVESGQSYHGRSVACSGIGTEGGVIHSDRATGVSSGHSSCLGSEGPNGKKR
jgi:hypothetical protein